MKASKNEKKFFFVQRLTELMEKEKLFLRPQLSVIHICSLLGTNRTYLSEYLNQVRDQTFYDYLADYRVEFAKKVLVEEPKMSIDEIGPYCGFNSISTFRRSFFKRVGITPLRYRHIQQKRRER